MKNKIIWFRAKTYGWGWYPSTWQGWLIIVAYLFFFIRISLGADKVLMAGGNVFYSVVLPEIVLTIVLIWICYKTGEKPGWRWGNKE
ncbi:MAG: hypothetical protein A2568_00530 [Candidatus Yanofskybacteria bacterium RIFOXYD1_FULL_44_17]|nr:MAG: hypothetical protein A2207_02360 [Candidatus Yanofskybacteria bacterium RIFOXYA1_FULL_44_17]OGN36735.1 MAG: hypothetical protein A2241_03025 [Candidatus Yanofskybacteria bacterium RIFOXYA2_FULL_45_28]OGN38201.1 MAG: hypothetical protein A2371_02135 [Candidatus Yanofskybacteria bacterium RIFOXYB1_FULL_44_29]OGN38988.1 MAG: hypothetical protein A2302_01570 [Candidatus Yanofskybacteria bacterium RIFOXYB2_FULL_44_18]OGN39180.1 MAG: hypothetical protein A2405_02665 [Candidatus Yanofskybacter